MAFISMLLVFIIIAAILLGGMFLAGLILLIVGIVTRRRNKTIGKKAPVVCIVIGSVLLGLSVLAASAPFIFAASSLIDTALHPAQYECVPDRWRSEWVYDTQAGDEIIKALFTAADQGDREAFSRNFTPELQGTAGFNDAVDAFFAAYPAGLSECQPRNKNTGGSGTYDSGSHIKACNTHFSLILDGKWHYVSIDFCYSNTDEPDKVGVTSLKVMNLEAAAVFFDEYDRDTHYMNDVFLLCDIQSPDEVCARLIADQPLLWTPTDTPKLTADELRDLLREYKRLDAPELKEKLGQPNASGSTSITTPMSITTS